jgi:hypothetical protein
LVDVLAKAREKRLSGKKADAPVKKAKVPVPVEKPKPKVRVTKAKAPAPAKPATKKK